MNKILSLIFPHEFFTKENIWATWAQIILGILVLALASQLSIPLNPVPLTFQSTTVILLALLFGPRMSAYMVIGYFMAGIAGIPVFADFSFGISKFVGPTGGYLLGFLPAALLSGYLIQTGFAKNLVTIFLTTLIGTLIIFFCGFLQLSLFVGQEEAFQLGVMPFLFSETCKLIAATILFSRIVKKRGN